MAAAILWELASWYVSLVMFEIKNLLYYGRRLMDIDYNKK